MRIAIIGFGREGQSLFKYLKRTPHYRGAEIWVLDKNPDIKVPQGVYARLGGYYLRNLEEFDVVFRSPGIPHMHPELVHARKRGVQFSSPTKLFFKEVVRRGSPRGNAKIIGVTGTKGKGTTSTLIYHMLKESGRDAHLGGNIGNPAIDFLPTLHRNSWVVLELSSFQLIDLEVSPHIAVALMITSEHLDWHKNIREYAAAKANIVRFQNPQDYAVIGEDYSRSKSFTKLTPGTVFTYSKEHHVEHGAWTEDGSFWFSDGKKKERICPTSDLWIPGFHNFDNTCAAIAAAKIAEVPTIAIQRAIKKFRGLEHRLQFVRNVNEVKYYDDSYSTVPETAIVAIRAFDAPKVLILGGSSKGSDFRMLGKLISESQSIRGIVGIGLEWRRIKRHIKNRRISMVEKCKTMSAIVRAARSLAKPGDVVLLSPACASFDMFQNYTDRGEQFKKFVRSLK